MFCLHCKEFFYDINEVYETRTDKWFCDMCPWCLGTRTVNASVRVMQPMEPFRIITLEIERRLRGKPKLLKLIKERWN